MTYNDFCEDYLKPLNREANMIPNWTFMSKTQLANGYSEAELKNDTQGMSHYFSAIVCKYWGFIPYFCNANKTLSYDTCYNWIVDGIMKGLRYKRWQDQESKLSKDIDGAKKVFDRCIWSVMNQYYVNLNRVNNKIISKAISLDALIDMRDVPEDILNISKASLYEEVNEYEKLENESIVDDIINNYITKQEIFKAMIVDTICYQNSFTNENTKEEAFSKNLVVRNINSIRKEDYYINYFCEKYKLNKDETKESVLSRLTDRHYNVVCKWLNKLIDRTLDELKKNRSLMESSYVG